MKTTGLTFAEAHASGRRYRCSEAQAWHRFKEIDLITIFEAMALYELEPIKKEISREDLAKAWGKIDIPMDINGREFVFSKLCQELGL